MTALVREPLRAQARAKINQPEGTIVTHRITRTATVIAALAATSIALAAPASATVEGPVWAHAAHQWANISVQDSTGPLWPVRASVAAWGSGLHYRACGTSQQCIRVSERNQGATGQIAITSQAWTTINGKSYYVPLTITINSYYNTHTTAAARSQIVKHELGHALGLNHDTFKDVMNADGLHSYDVISATPNRSDLYNLYRR